MLEPEFCSSLMRYARFAIFLSAIMIATGVFLPYIQLGVGGVAFSKGSSITLYSTVNNYGFLEAVASSVDVSLAERITNGLLATAAPKSKSLAKKLRDAQSTLRDVQEVHEEAHVKTLGTVLRITGMVFLGILLIVCWLVLKSLSLGTANRRRAIVVCTLMGSVSIAGIALFIVAGESLKLGNAELGAPLLSLGSGAFLMLIGAGCGLVAAFVALRCELAASARVTPAA